MDTQVPHDINNNIPSTLHVDALFSQEPDAIKRSLEKHDKRQESVEFREGWGATTGGKAIAKAYLQRMSDAVAAVFNAPRGGSDGARGDRADAHLIRILSGLGDDKDRDAADVVALAILQTSLHCLARREDLTNTFLTVGGTLSFECWGAELTTHDPQAAKRIAKAHRARHGALKEKSAKQHASKLKKNPFTQRDWDNEELARAGAWGVGIMLDALADVFTVRTEGAHKNTREYLELSDAAWAVVDEALGAAINGNPVFWPETVPPKPWDAWSGCGPVDARVNGTVTFLRSSAKDTIAAMRAAIRNGTAKPALDAVNTLQGTAWTLNKPLLDIITTCADRQYQVDGLPQWKKLPVPKKLPDVVWAAMDEDRQRFVRQRKAEIHQLNNAAKCDRIQYNEDMKVAQAMASHDTFWTPMNCDWRGRVYGVTHFNFQREDRVRALFLFKDGEPLGADGMHWLKMHVANCGAFNKIDKRPIKERVQWVDDNIEMLKLIAAKPLDTTVPYGINLAWTQADSPFLFLAACMELAAALSVGEQNYICHLPVSFDGSCSGLQHLSAMTRASEGALVNLVPNELPQDIYQSVADLLKVVITADLDHEPENPEDEEQVKASDRIRAIARLTLDHKVTRKLVKRNVMTYAYSSKKFGMACQLQVDLMAPLQREVLEGKREEHPFAPYQDGDAERPGAAARYLAERIFNAIEEKVKKPSEAMKMLQKLARAMAHEKAPLRWTTPVGLPWINRYHDPKTKRVELFMQSGGVTVRRRATITVGDEPEINKDRSANGVAPNFVHALDSSHLMLVVNAAAMEGIIQIATVHDSFGCLPSRATRFRSIILEEFVRMYEQHDVLSEVLSQATCDLTQNNHHMLPPGIDFGPLNLKDVLNAEFAFA